MNYISNIFKRAHIQQIREFLLSGAECVRINEKTYIERLEEAQKKAFDKLLDIIPDEEEYEEILSNIIGYIGETEDVYMEIGLQCGAMLAQQLNN